MKKKSTTLLMSLIFISLSHTVRSQPIAVTHTGTEDWGGRFGDQVIMYIKAKWVAYKYNAPFFYRPFPFSDQLMMHELDTPWNPQVRRKFKRMKVLKNIENSNLDTIINQDTHDLYVIHYYFMQSHWGSYQQQYDSQEISEWKDVIHDNKFRDELRKVIRPRTPIKICSLPPDRISVAVHVRKGGGFDWPLLSQQEYDQEKVESENVDPYTTNDIYSDRVWPLKFPPDQFYINQIKHISNLLKDAPLYVHIFTDHQDPSALVERYKNAINKPNIIYGCRTQMNHHSKNISEDLFSMAQCDYLIRGGSNFPQIAQLIGNHRIVLFPRSMKWINKTMIIDPASTIINEAH